MAGGRPTKYKPEYVELAFNYSLLGATDAQMAKYFDVSEQTLNAWKWQFPEFLEALKKGKEEADASVAKRLYHRAKGYTHKEDKIFLHEGEPVVVPTEKHYPPDTTAAIFWLKNRQRDKWRDVSRQEISAPGGESLQVQFNIPRPGQKEKPGEPG